MTIARSRTRAHTKWWRHRPDEVNSFLQRVEETQLLQRIITLDLTSPSFDGNPQLNVSLTAEGLALSDAVPRTRLFPTTGLAAKTTAGQTTIEVASAPGFPEQAPFRIRIDDEFLDVLETGEDGWKVERGVAGTTPAEHPEDANVELLPLRTANADEGRQLLPAVERLFVKYRPRTTGGVEIVGALPPAARGKPWTTELNLRNWNVAEGRPIYKLGPDAPSGMFLDAELGKLSWTPAADAELRKYDVPVAVYGLDESVPVLDSNLTVEVRVPNTPPTLQLPRRPVSVWLGRPFTYKVLADDKDLPNDRLQFSLTGEDVRRDADRGSTGVLIWTLRRPPSQELANPGPGTDDGSPGTTRPRRSTCRTWPATRTTSLRIQGTRRGLARIDDEPPHAALRRGPDQGGRHRRHGCGDRAGLPANPFFRPVAGTGLRLEPPGSEARGGERNARKCGR